PRWHTNGPPRSHRTKVSVRGCSPRPRKAPGSAGAPAAQRSRWRRARPLASEPLQRADIDRYLGLVELTGGVPTEACRLLVRSAAAVASDDGERALELLNLASVAAFYAEDVAAAVTIAELARKVDVKDTTVDR